MQHKDDSRKSIKKEEREGNVRNRKFLPTNHNENKEKKINFVIKKIACTFMSVCCVKEKKRNNIRKNGNEKKRSHIIWEFLQET